MWHVALGMGILITNVILKPVYFSLAFQSRMTVGDSYRLQLFAELCLLVGLAIAWFIERSLALKARIPAPVPGYWALKVGVWVFLMVWATLLAIRTVPYAVYVIGVFPSRYLIQSQIPAAIASGFILYGLARTFLASRPLPTGRQEPNNTVERDASKSASRPSL
jgi:hypothetical protein